MHQISLIIFVALSCRFSKVTQNPMDSGRYLPAENAWALETAPESDATGHMIFNTVHSLLQHWPNTRYRNGHNLVPGTVPVGTLLYHGRTDPNVPEVPEWVALDPEFSDVFCRTSPNACWHLTFIVTRPLQILYFDGSSAAKMKNGSLDSQDLVIWGKILPDQYFDEESRINVLCAWGKPLGIDAYVRMGMSFEIMLCDFKAGVEVVSIANLAPQSPPGPWDTPGGFQALYSASWQNRYPGDRRIKLDLTRLVSFYDGKLAPSLVAKRRGQERWDHRLLGIASVDVAAVMNRLTEAYTGPPIAGSGIDWDAHFRVVVNRYADRFEMVRYTLNNASSDSLVAAQKAISQLRVMLKPYILDKIIPHANGAWATPVFKTCATAHTDHIRRSTTLSVNLTPSEKLLLNAAEETTREICRVIVRIWAEGVVAGLDEALPVANPIQLNSVDLLDRWKTALDDLMAWLDWSVWIKCRPQCSFEEMCYLPTWPFDFLEPFQIFPPEDFSEEYLRPKPQCIRRLEPYTF
ncbi:hypothetical protein C8R46DRAFT_943392 [Mycena filopes]|nr:hypothetical protein C8R46DRAFT_943392 [Mycena filopes]